MSCTATASVRCEPVVCPLPVMRSGDPRRVNLARRGRARACSRRRGALSREPRCAHEPRLNPALARRSRSRGEAASSIRPSASWTGSAAHNRPLILSCTSVSGPPAATASTGSPRPVPQGSPVRTCRWSWGTRTCRPRHRREPAPLPPASPGRWRSRRRARAPAPARGRRRPAPDAASGRAALRPGSLDEQLGALLVGDPAGIEHIHALDRPVGIPQKRLVASAGSKRAVSTPRSQRTYLLGCHPDRGERLVGGVAGGEHQVAGVVEGAHRHRHRICHALALRSAASRRR